LEGRGDETITLRLIVGENGLETGGGIGSGSCRMAGFDKSSSEADLSGFRARGLIGIRRLGNLSMTGPCDQICDESDRPEYRKREDLYLSTLLY
jgi:hypothetical protein